ncbi:MAG: transporter, partial [Frankiales bacterium]|nr:transporter [Frankiales bacterium]
LGLFANRQFTAANIVTFAVYAAIGAFFFLLVVHLQVVAGYPPLAAGAGVLPVTACMLLLSARAGALSARIGPRLPMTAGPLLSAAGVMLVSRIGPGADYLADVFPGTLVFGLGLALTVAPLTATVLGSVATRHAGVASGVNNAVARTAGLLAVATLPVLGGISGADYTDPVAFGEGFTIAMRVAAGLLVLGAGLAVVLVRGGPVVEEPRRYCAVDGPPLAPVRA